MTKTRLSVAGSMALILAGCATPAASVPKGEKRPEPRDVETARMSEGLARMRLAAAEADLKVQEAQGAQTLAGAESEYRQAQMRQGAFEIERKKRLMEAELAVKGARDRIEDSVEELDQLEKMYQENALADSTKELVLKRGRRQLERAREGLTLQEMGLAKLRDQDLPAEQEKLANDLSQKKAAAEQARARLDLLLQQKKTACEEARLNLHKAEGELKKLQKDPAKPAGDPEKPKP